MDRQKRETTEFGASALSALLFSSVRCTCMYRVENGTCPIIRFNQILGMCTQNSNAA
jgi:hypothetical protein